MTLLLTYILQASIAGAFCYLLYYFFLRMTTFFKWNRTFFLIAIALSVSLPLLNFASESLPEQPVKAVEQYIPNLSFQSEADSDTNWKFLIANLFYAGIIIMSVRFILQLFSILNLGKKSEKHKLNDVVIVNTSKNISPFSFFNHIYVNSKQHSAADFEQILRHEVVHAKEGHSFDILLAEIYNIVFWFNPFAWLIKNSLKQNLEFITDTKVLKSGVDAKLYQYCLLKVSGIHTNMAAANHFNFIKLKNRIIMMNKKRSSQLNIFKYLLLLPLITFLLMSFNRTASKPGFHTHIVKNDRTPGAALNDNEWAYAASGGIKTDTVPEAMPSPPSPPNVADVLEYIPKNKANKGVKIVTDLESGKTVVITKAGVKEEYNLSDEKERNRFETKYGELPPPPPPTLPAPPPPPPTMPVEVPAAINLNAPADAQPLIIVDGKEVVSIKEVDEKTIKAVNILKDEEALKSYGEKGKNGVVIVSTKVTPEHDGVRSVKSVNVVSPAANVKPVIAETNGNVVAETGEDKLLNSKGTEDAMFFINGKETSRSEALKIRAESIYKINIVTDAANLKKYGKKGKHGVIEITTK
ncbi:MAG: M56 family metallopeptidase [Ginsengibacter sp.]